MAAATPRVTRFASNTPRGTANGTHNHAAASTAQEGQVVATRSASTSPARVAAHSQRLAQEARLWSLRTANQSEHRHAVKSRAEAMLEHHRGALQRKQQQEDNRFLMNRAKYADCWSSKLHERDTTAQQRSASVERARARQEQYGATLAQRLEQNLVAASMRHQVALNQRAGAVAQTVEHRLDTVRSRKEAIDAQRKAWLQEKVEAKMNASSGTPGRVRSASAAASRGTTPTACAGPSHGDHIDLCRRRAAGMQQVRGQQLQRQIEDEEARAQRALAAKEMQIAQRRVEKERKEAEAQQRVAAAEARRLAAQERYKQQFEDAVTIGQQTAAHNKMYRLGPGARASTLRPW